MSLTESNLSSAITGAVQQWAISLPMIGMWIAGLLFAFSRWRRNPKVSLLVIVSCGLSLAETLVMPVVTHIVCTVITPTGGSIPAVWMAVSFLTACLAALSSGLLIYAALVDRPERGY
jgi:hypothetical protein